MEKLWLEPMRCAPCLEAAAYFLRVELSPISCVARTTFRIAESVVSTPWQGVTADGRDLFAVEWEA